MRVTSQSQHHLLKIGSTGERVERLEERLKQLGHLKGPVDDTFDARTADAVQRYKRVQGWKPRPVVGDRMADALELNRPHAHIGAHAPGTRTPTTMRGGTYNCEIGRDPEKVAKFVEHAARSQNLDFLQLQEISGYHRALEKIPGYHLVTFPGSKDHGETGVLVKDDLKAQLPRSLQSDEGWTNVRGGVAQPRAATKVTLGGWLDVVSLHAPPGIDWKNGHAVGPEQRIKSYGSLMEKLRDAARTAIAKGRAVLLGGDWNEGARTGGKWSPSWLASQAGLHKDATGRIDWEMSHGARVTDMRVRDSGGSDHRLVTFTVSKRG